MAETADGRVPNDRDVHQLLTDVTDNWTIAVAASLRLRTTRFGELHRSVTGISPRMLTRTLRKMERAGLATRHVGSGSPPTVHYALTALGITFHDTVGGLIGWAANSLDAIQEHRRCYDLRSG
jgi:DNA-binding HxlR family transcriptional regulator